MKELVVPPWQAGERLDRTLARWLGISGHEAREALLRGIVRVNGHRARKGDPVRGGDRLTVTGEVGPAAALPDPSLDLRILHLDVLLVGIDKPAGVPSQPLQREERGTVANFLVARFPEMAHLGGNPLDAGLVHRLDIDTSGVLLAARTQPALEHLRQQFRERRVEKEYLALVAGDVVAEGEIRVPLVHDADPGRMRPARTGAGEMGREAVTFYAPRERLGPLTLVAVRIETGVMHQIRVHLASIGHPVLGDRLYGGLHATAAPRQMLHASRLVVTHPASGAPVVLASPLPEDFRVRMNH